MGVQDLPKELHRLLPNMSEWQIDSFIGKGRFGRVYQISKTDAPQQQAALKWIAVAPSADEIQQYHSRGLSDASIAEVFDQRKEKYLSEVKLMYDLQGESSLVNFQEYSAYQRSNGIGWDILLRMQLLTPLKKYIQRVGITASMIQQIGVSISYALMLCHQKNIIHGDVKVENIFCNPDALEKPDSEQQYKLGDFSLSFQKDVYDRKRGGTPGYLAPECAAGGDKTEASDQYALGMTLYGLMNELELPLPEHTSNVSSTLPKHCVPELWTVVKRAISEKPEDRYSDMQAMNNALNNIAAAQIQNYIWTSQQEGDTHNSTYTDVHMQNSIRAESEGILQGLPDMQKNIPEAQEMNLLQDDCETGSVADHMHEEEIERERIAREKKRMKWFRIALIAVTAVVIAVGIIMAFSIATRRAEISDIECSEMDGRYLLQWKNGGEGPWMILACHNNGKAYNMWHAEQRSHQLPLCPGEYYTVALRAENQEQSVFQYSIPEKEKAIGAIKTVDNMFTYRIRENDVSPEKSNGAKKSDVIIISEDVGQLNGMGYFIRLRWDVAEFIQSSRVDCYLLYNGLTELLSFTVDEESNETYETILINDLLMKGGLGGEKMVCKLYVDGLVLTEMSYTVMSQ